MKQIVIVEKLPIFPCNLIIIIGGNTESAHKVIQKDSEQKLVFKEIPSEESGFTCEVDGNVYIWVNKLKTVEDKSIFFHEMYHAVHKILARVMIKPVDDTEEVYAYLFSYIYRQIKKKLPNL